VLPFPTTLDELKNRITAAVAANTPEMLAIVWDEFNYHVDVCRASSEKGI